MTHKDRSVVRKKLITSETIQAQFSHCIWGPLRRKKKRSLPSLDMKADLWSISRDARLLERDGLYRIV
jgi:hypothetical protein